MLRAIIIDDEKSAREVISGYLNDYCHDVDVVGTAASVNEAFAVISELQPDLLFLDVELPDGKGFELLERFDSVDFRVIFVTAYSDYAIKAFRYSAADYLLKPVDPDELKEAVSKVRDSKGLSLDPEILSALLRNLREDSPRQSTLIIPHTKGFEVLRVPEIIMCQADGYCTNFFLTGHRKVVSSRNLKHFATLLEEHQFIRVHHSFLVNSEFILSYTRQGEITLIEGLKASVGDSYKSYFLKKFTGS